MTRVVKNEDSGSVFMFIGHDQDVWSDGNNLKPLSRHGQGSKSNRRWGSILFRRKCTKINRRLQDQMGGELPVEIRFAYPVKEFRYPCDFRSTLIVRNSNASSNHVSMDARGSGRTIFDTAMAMISLDSASARCFFSISTMPMSFTIFIMGMKRLSIGLLPGMASLIFHIPPLSFLPTYL